MTIQEVIEDLRSEVKPYIPVRMLQGTFSATLMRIEGGSAKRGTIKEFFAKFGYEGDYNDWHKVDNKQYIISVRHQNTYYAPNRF